MNKVGDNVQVIWGATFDDSLGDNVKITIIATGYDVSDIPGMPTKLAKEVQKTPVHNSGSVIQNVVTAIHTSLNADKAEKEEREITEEEMRKAMDQYYGKQQASKAVPEPEPEPEPEPDLQTFTLEELEDESTLKSVENIPAWKRRLLR
jgi:cell division protein FtsZ